MYDIFKPRFLEFTCPLRILVGGGGSTTSVDTVAREAAAAAQQSVDDITAQSGEVIVDGQGVISSDGKQYVNNTGGDITLSGGSSAALVSDGLTAVSSAAMSSNALFSYDDISQLVASTEISIGQAVEVSGYHQKGDGGRNRFEIVAAGTGVADGGSFIDLTASGLQAKGVFPDGCLFEQWGVAKDGVTDDAPMIQAALDWCSANGVKDIRASGATGQFAISGSIQLKESVYVDFSYAEMAPLSDTAGFVLAKKSSIENLKWTGASRPSWVGPLLLANDSTDSSISTYPRLRNISCEGYKDNVNHLVAGVMLKLDASAGTRICGIRGSGLYAGNLETVVQFIPSDGGLSGWVNSNHLEFDMIYNCNRCFDMNRLSTDASNSNNYIKTSYQPGQTAQAGVLRCNSSRNEFDFLIWDLGAAGDPVNIEFGADSTENLVRGSFNPLLVKDAGVSSFRNQIQTRTFPTVPFGIYAAEPASTNSGLFLGHVDNCLAYSDKRYSVSAPEVSEGSLSSVFTPNQNSRAVWPSVSSITIDIDLLQSFSALRTIGVVFCDGYIPDSVIFEKSSDGVNYTEIETVPGAQISAWAGRTYVGGSFQFIRITVSTATAQDAAIAQIFGWWKGVDQGAYLPTGGGQLVGDTTVKSGKSVLFSSSNGNGSAKLNVDNSNRLSLTATGGVKLNGTRILGDQQPAVTDPAGGSVVDAECRAALIALADRIRNHGLISL